MKNFYFENYQNSAEQDLIESLIVESIRIYGIDSWYLPRTVNGEDDLLNEDDVPSFTKAFMIEQYIKNIEGFEGEGDFLSKFGLQIRDSVTLTMANRTFFNEVSTFTGFQRPREGDLIYLPLNRKMFEITHVEHEAVFYQMGALQTFDLRCELMDYADQRFATGIPEIDNLFKNYEKTSNTSIDAIEDFDPFADNLVIQNEANSVLDFSESNPFGEDNF